MIQGRGQGELFDEGGRIPLRFKGNDVVGIYSAGTGSRGNNDVYGSFRANVIEGVVTDGNFRYLALDVVDPSTNTNLEVALSSLYSLFVKTSE